MENLFQLIDPDGDHCNFYRSERSSDNVQRLISKFYEMELDGDIDDFLKERGVHIASVDTIINE